MKNQSVRTSILLLGFVSLLADLSSDMMMPILPMFIISLGGTGLVVGLIGGLGDSVASILKVFSGYWSDRLGKKKALVFSGYSVSAISKLFFPLSTIWHHLAILRPIERVGKGMREAPRDAMIAAYTEKGKKRGKWFGVHRAMDNSGAILGSLIAFLLFWYMGFDFRTILWVSALIAFLALTPFAKIKDVYSKRKKSACRWVFLSFHTL